MDFEVIWTEPALTDFESIVRYLNERNPRAAESVRQDVLNHVELLRRFPFIGPLYERDRTGRAREIVCGSYRIFYRVDETGKRVEILTVWHGSRSEPTLPE
ncbi:MAG: type II toxin-antitoxin system RelE/ParE family toxin [Planctomycetia bacterium]|nr:type II toxin-antitoxin system RelE/ParE family toxin [Planctomycetia bacterium]